MNWLKKVWTLVAPSPERKKQHLQRYLKRRRIGSLESAMIEGVMDAKDTAARDLMVPRVDVFALEAEMSKKETLALVAKANHSRFPVFSDNIDNIVGIVHLRDIFKALQPNKKNFSLTKLISSPYFIPESRPVLSILEDLKKDHRQLAVVVDEYGGFSGIITMEDIIEEIIGDVQDEWDDEDEPMIALENGEHSLDPRLQLREVNQLLGLNLEDDKADTLGGYVINLFGHLPKGDESVTFEQIVFTVKSKKRNGIHRIHIGSTSKVLNTSAAAKKQPIKGEMLNGKTAKTNGKTTRVNGKPTKANDRKKVNKEKLANTVRQEATK